MANKKQQTSVNMDPRLIETLKESITGTSDGDVLRKYIIKSMAKDKLIKIDESGEIVFPEKDK